MTKSKRRIALVLAVMMMFSVVSMSASAANTDDVYFWFTFGSNGKDNNNFERKTNTTPPYIKLNNICSGGFDVFVDGANSAKPAAIFIYGRTSGKPHISKAGKEYFVPNTFTKSNLTSYARLGGYKANGSPVTSYGYWSPDSIQTGGIVYLTS